MKRPSKFRKRCKSCGVEYTLLTFTALPLPDDGRGESSMAGVLLILRHCPCGGTLAVQASDLFAPDGASA